MAYSLEDFSYHLPSELIAQKPMKPRDRSRLLLLNRLTGALEHRHFYELVDYLRPGDLLVLNNSRVFPARLIGHKETSGGEIEIFLLHHLSEKKWECLVKGRVREGLRVVLDKNLIATLLKNNQDGTWQLAFNQAGSKFLNLIERIGQVPLPPYIKRGRGLRGDRNDYQTIFADKNQAGSVAAPTAGLHFTKNLLKKIKARGIKIGYITLHVGLGTFAPVKVQKIEEHRMHRELVIVAPELIKEILKTKQAGGRVVAVGTTTCRSLEALDWPKIKKQTKIGKQRFWTDIFIYPGYQFKVVDALITNFHLPKSTLLMLVSALAGKKRIDQAYRVAVAQKYRFFSYGDAMFIY